MGGVNHKLVADQLGTSMEMLKKNYTKWLHGEETKQAFRQYEVYKQADKNIIPFKR